MEVVGLFFVLVAVLVGLAFPVMAIVAFVRASQAVRDVEQLRARVAELSRRAAAAAPPPQATPQPTAQSTAPPTPQPTVEPTASAAVPPASVPAAARASSPPAPAAASSPPPPLFSPLPARSDQDFVASIGPKILVGAGGLAVVTFLALFVRYAWENNWVGPLGRVLSACAFSLALVVTGLRIMDRRWRYRPLGQGLAAAGFAGLYVTGWAAHVVYDLVSRGVSSGLLLAVVASAALVAARTGARLLAGLAWVGGYLAPILLSTGEDRGETLFAYLVLLAASALWLDRRKRWPELLVIAALGTFILYIAWFDSHFSAERFWVAAAGLLALSAIFALGPARVGGLETALAVLAAAASGVTGIVIAADADKPLALAALLVALAVLAELSVARSPWTRPIAAALSAASVLAWHASFFETGRTAEALILGLGVALVHIGLLTAADLRARPPGLQGALAHLAASLLAFATLDRVLQAGSDGLFVSILALAGLHLLLGFHAWRGGGERLRARVALGLAVAFLTMALPVKLGLDGTTLAWAAEGVLLTWLGVKQRSALARGYGYVVLFLALCRLFLRHVPLHPEPFTPVLNASFGVWLFVIAAMAVTRRLARSVGDDGGEAAWLDGACVLFLGPLTLALLLGLLSHETTAYFGHVSRAATNAGDRDGALRAERQGGLALSVLWTLFATGLLSAGLLMRSLPLFYTSYALFAVTAAKIVLVDVSTLPTFYRMLSFLALGALLLAGAWLNLRFRERLTAASGAGVLRS
jgi:hypothetical protein